MLNGPNLNLLGVRQPHIYGSCTLEDIENACTLSAKAHGYDLVCHQSNTEGNLIDHLHTARRSAVGVVLNAAAYTHTSVALADAVASMDIPVIEVHLSNVHKRESYRHHSYLAPVVLGQITGFGMDSYTLAIDALVSYLKHIVSA